MKNTVIKILETSLNTDPFASLEPLNESGYNLWAMKEPENGKDEEGLGKDPSESSHENFEDNSLELGGVGEDEDDMPRGHQSENAFEDTPEFTDSMSFMHGPMSGSNLPAPEGMGMGEPKQYNVHPGDVAKVIAEFNGVLKSLIKELGKTSSNAEAGIPVSQLQKIELALEALKQINLGSNDKPSFGKKDDEGHEKKKSPFGKKEDSDSDNEKGNKKKSPFDKKEDLDDDEKKEMTDSDDADSDNDKEEKKSSFGFK